jgi:hypothetical protein
MCVVLNRGRLLMQKSVPSTGGRLFPPGTRHTYGTIQESTRAGTLYAYTANGFPGLLENDIIVPFLETTEYGPRAAAAEVLLTFAVPST